MFVSEVTRYQTGDGKLHKTKEDAENHSINAICQIVDDKIGSLSGYKALKHSDKMAIILNLVGTKEKFYNLLKELEKFDF